MHSFLSPFDHYFLQFCHGLFGTREKATANRDIKTNVTLLVIGWLPVTNKCYPGLHGRKWELKLSPVKHFGLILV